MTRRAWQTRRSVRGAGEIKRRSGRAKARQSQGEGGGVPGSFLSAEKGIVGLDRLVKEGLEEGHITISVIDL